MSNKIKLRLKEGRYLVVATPNFSIIVKDGGDNDPDGFEVDKVIYEKYLKKVAEPVTKKQTKKREEKSIVLEE